MQEQQWKKSLHKFFAERASEISHPPSHADLCYVSGRDPRLWMQMQIYEDLIQDILRLARATENSNILEVGCAAGFLAKGIAPRVKNYTGLDLAEPPLSVARRLDLKNATYQLGDGASLSFPDGQFDAAFCYDVFTNFPSFADGISLIREMARVVKPNGIVVIGSIPDRETQTEYEGKVQEVSRDLQDKFGAAISPATTKTVSEGGFWDRLAAFTRLRPGKPSQVPNEENVKAEIVCFYFDKADFISLSDSLNASVEISDIHHLNPYKGFRFNATYVKRGP